MQTIKIMQRKGAQGGLGVNGQGRGGRERSAIIDRKG